MYGVGAVDHPDAMKGRHMNCGNECSTEIAATDGSDLFDFTEAFLTHLRGYRRCAESTITAYRGDLSRFARFLQARKLPTCVEEITHRHIRAFAASLSDKAPATINRNLDALSSFFTHLVDTGVVDVNPVKGVERPKRPRKLPRSASVEQCCAIMAATSTERDRAMLALLMCTGIRRGELLGLDVSDLAADLSEVKISGKGERERLMPIPEQCRWALNAHLGQRESDQSALFLNKGMQQSC